MELSESKILILALQQDDKYIPIWKLKHKDSEEYGDIYYVDNEWKGVSKSSLKQVYYDINTGAISTGEIIDIYPKEDSVYKIGDKILVEEGHKELINGTISEVLYDIDHNSILFGKRIKEGRYFNNTSKIEDSKLYNINTVH